jgi:hypothetical protein
MVRPLRKPGTELNHGVAVRQAAALGEQPRAFVFAVWKPGPSPIAVGAGEPQIRQLVRPAARNGPDMVDGATPVSVAELEAAVPASVTVTLEQTSDSKGTP